MMTLANLASPFLADYLYVGGGLITLVVIVLIVVLLVRR